MESSVEKRKIQIELTRRQKKLADVNRELVNLEKVIGRSKVKPFLVSSSRSLLTAQAYRVSLEKKFKQLLVKRKEIEGEVKKAQQRLAIAD